MALTRQKNPMPKAIEKRLTDESVMSAYHARPDYQQNDYLRWIAQAKQEETKSKRVEQMISELKGGKKYMKMDYNGIAHA